MTNLRETVSLAGQWRFLLDRNAYGLREQWQRKTLPDAITLPGILQAQGYGDDITTETTMIHGLNDKLWFLKEEYVPYAQENNVKLPFAAMPEKHYTGMAWYQTDIVIPQTWDGRFITFSMERPKWKTMCWLDDQLLGENDSLCAPHAYDLGIPGAGTYTLTVMVDNSMIYPYRPDSHSISDSGGNSWNGIVGDITLNARSNIRFEDVRAYPNIKNKSIRFVCEVAGDAEIIKNAMVHVDCKPPKPRSTKFWNNGYMLELLPPEGAEELCARSETFRFTTEHGAHIHTLTCTLELGSCATLWDEFDPYLYNIQIDLIHDDVVCDDHSLQVGLREVKAYDNQFMLNGKRIYLRGTNDHGCFPLTGYPPTDKASWRRIYRICKDWGMNHIRYHSFCPPKAAFEAADELGLYLHIETGGWNYFQEGNRCEQHLYAESERILKAYGNHASFMMFCSGNEPHGNWEPVLKKWCAAYREKDDRRLYATQCGRTLPINIEPIDFQDYHYTVSRGDLRARRQSGWFGKDFDHVFEGLSGPFLAHELGQHCAFPDFDVIEKFTGYLKPGHYEIFKQQLIDSGLYDQRLALTEASGQLQAMCYKEEIEANLRTKAFSGFSLLDLHDYIGQCGALCGLLDPFWDQKSYVGPTWFKRFNAPVVPLARLEKHVYEQGDVFSAHIEIANYLKDFNYSNVSWDIVDTSGLIQESGSFICDIKAGGNTFVGSINTTFSQYNAPAAYKLIVGIRGTDYENDWDFWLMEQKPNVDADMIHITKNFNDAIEQLKQGAKVLFLPPQSSLAWNCPPLNFAPVFWNAQMGPNWSRPLGLLNDTDHPLFQNFPSDIGLDWHYNELVLGVRAMNVSLLDPALKPIIQPIDDWNRNSKLAALFECNMYQGKLMVCSFDLENLENRPAARQLRSAIIQYMTTDFKPAVTLQAEALQTFLFNTLIMKQLAVNASVTSHFTETEQNEIDGPFGKLMKERNVTNPHVIENIISGDANQYWLAGGRYGSGYPFDLYFKTPSPVVVKGLCIMPRQNQRDMEGAVKDIEIAISVDGKSWTTVYTCSLPRTFNVQNILFETPVTLTALRLTLKSGFGADNVNMWYIDQPEGWTHAKRTFIDRTASLAQVAFITDITADDQEITLTEGKTDSDEIY